MTPALLLTATIDPRGARMTFRSAPDVRLQDYASALSKWRQAIAGPIVFCENSGADLRPLQQALGADAARVEWLSFDAPPYPQHRGKGYGEALIIRHALERSRAVQTSSHVVKMTGRLFLSNAARMWNALPDDVDICCDLCPYRLVVSDCRIFAARPQFITDYLLPETELLDEDAFPIVHFERALGRATLRAIADGLSWKPLPYTPAYVGVSASHHFTYRNRGLWLRDAARRFKALRASRLGP